MPVAGPLHVHYSLADRELFLRFERAATFQVCPIAAELIETFLSRGPSKPQLVLDLSRCEFLDSTFAGWMIRIQRLLKQKSGQLILSGCSGGCRRSLGLLGISGIFLVQPHPGPETTLSVCCDGTGATTGLLCQLVAESHEELAAAQPEQCPKHG